MVALMPLMWAAKALSLRSQSVAEPTGVAELTSMTVLARVSFGAAPLLICAGLPWQPAEHVGTK